MFLASYSSYRCTVLVAGAHGTAVMVHSLFKEILLVNQLYSISLSDHRATMRALGIVLIMNSDGLRKEAPLEPLSLVFRLHFPDHS